MNTHHRLPEDVIRALRGADEPVGLVLHRAASSSELERRLNEFAQNLSDACEGGIEHLIGDGSGPPDLPALTLRRGGRDAVHYLAIPEGPEAAPFHEALISLAAPAPVRGRDGLTQPVDILVFIAPGCPNCPHAVRAATQLAATNPQVTTTVVDATHFATMAESFVVRSVPTTVVDGDLTLVGVLSLEDLVGSITQALGEDGERQVLRSLIDSGRLGYAGRGLAAGRFVEGFAGLWLTSGMESRIALVLAAEEALAIEPTALDRLATMLLPATTGPDSARRGDTADLLGRIGCTDARNALRTMLTDSDPDVAEAASDALESLEHRNG